jgi:hypothetical protein
MPSPNGYLAWHEWAEEMSKTHKQVKCEGCGRYSIWRTSSPLTRPLSQCDDATSQHPSHERSGDPA